MTKKDMSTDDSILFVQPSEEKWTTIPWSRIELIQIYVIFQTLATYYVLIPRYDSANDCKQDMPHFSLSVQREINYIKFPGNQFLHYSSLVHPLN